MDLFDGTSDKSCGIETAQIAQKKAWMTRSIKIRIFFSFIIVIHHSVQYEFLILNLYIPREAKLKVAVFIILIVSISVSGNARRINQDLILTVRRKSVCVCKRENCFDPLVIMALFKIVGDSLVLRTSTKGFSWSRHANGAAAACSGTDFARTPFSDKRYNRVRCRYSPMSYPVTAATSCRWNSSDSSNASASKTLDDEKKSPLRIPRTLARHVWPSDDSLKSKQRKKQVVLALSLMLAGKGVTIQVPYIFKSLVDTLQIDATNAIETVATLTPATLDLTTMTTAAGLPVITVLMGYGMSRAAASGFQELRNAVFANVTQQAIRKVGRSVFQHVQTLDMQFHLSKNTGKVSRILDRGNRSISFVCDAMVFHAAPTTVEVGLVTGLVYYQFGLSHASVVLGTIATYTAFTAGITQWRTKFRRDMNRLENQASSRVVDSLVNYETVQYFNNLPHEV